MFREYINQLKNYNFLEKIQQGYYLDAKDQNRWKVGQVQKLRKIGHKLTVQIMFDGYSYKYNQTYDLPSYSKLAPFRKFTLPYTGTTTTQVKRQQPSKTLEHYIKTLNKFGQDIDNHKAQIINQYLRGQLFIYIDYALTRSSKIDLKYSYEDYIRLFNAYLQFFDKILDKVFEFLKEIEKEGNLDQNLIYVHPKMALLYSLTQFFFNCNSLISKNEERVTFHKHFGKHQSIDQIYIGLLQKMKLLKLYEKCQRLMSYKTLNNLSRSLPWSIKKQCLILMKSINPVQPFLLPKDNKQIIQFLQFLPYFSKKSIISFQQQQKCKIQLIFNLILGGNFEGKLIGLNQLKKLISYSYSSYSSAKKDAIILQNIKQKKLINFFLDNNNFNSQLFKRALIVFEYAYKNKIFTKQHFSMVLKLHKDKHQLELLNFYNSLAQFGAFLNQLDAIQYFQTIIKQLPFEENFIQLIKNYTIVLIDKNSHYKKLYMPRDQLGFGLIYFWQQINNQNKINKDLIHKMIEGFATLLNNLYYGKQIQRFIVSSIKAIKQNKNPESFLKVIHQSLKLCKGSRMNKAIQIAEKEINVIQAAMTMLREQENNLSKTGFQNLFEFLQEVNYISRKGLMPNDILFMWKMDKTKCRVHLLRFLRKFKLRSNQDKSQQKIIYKSLDIGQIQFIIKNVFQSDDLMENYQQIDEEHYQTIDELILCYLNNKKIIDYNYKHTIRYRKNQYFVQDDKMFLGMKFYLKCIQNNKDKYKQISIKATKRLIQIFLRPNKDDFSKNTVQLKVKNWLRVSKAFDNLKNHRLRSFQIQLEEIYGRMKSLNILQPDILEIRVKLAGTNKIHTFNIPKYTSLWKFRLMINEKFELKNSNFDIQLIQQRTSTNLQRQQDLSVLFINLSKQKNGVSVVVNQSKEMHPHFKAIQIFKEELIDSYGTGLFHNLGSSEKQKTQMSLEILFKLPFLKSLQKSLQNFQYKDWSQIIDKENMKKLEYELLIIQSFKDLKWIMSFISKNGLKHLTQIVIFNVGKNNYRTINLLMNFFIEAIKFAVKSSNFALPFNQQYLKDILIYQKQGNQEYLTFLLNCFTLIKEVSAKVKLTILFEKQNINKILQTVLFTKRKSNISTQLIQICKSANNNYTNLNKNLYKFLNFEYLKTKMYECRPFFQLLQILIQRGLLDYIDQPIQKLILEVRNSDLKQRNQNQINQLLYGYLLCFYQFIKANRVEDILAQKKGKFFSHLLNQCLFHPENISLRKFKSKELRQLGFRFLEMLQFESKNQDQINKLLIPMMSKGSWRKQFDWNIQPMQFISKKFTGLKNLAATCYINSLLQQLFYINNFSSQLMNIDSGLIEDKQNIVREIQNIFGFLKYSQNPSFTTTSLCQTFILDGQPIDPRIQTDVDQFFHALMDKLERNLEKINKKDIINQIFRGQFSNLIIGQQCPHTSQRIQHFLSIRLQIKNKKTIYQALQQFIKGQILEGQNAYFCQKCDKKVKAMKRVCLKDLPPVMIVTLKRFQFDFDTMQKFKLNTYCSFPQRINFLPYTKEGLQEQAGIRKQEYQYRLKGVVIHYGISQAGHYTSYVRTDENSWNYFDDQRINEFDLKNLQKQCFGGIEQNPFGDDQQKKKNAYLLIYEKVSPSQTLKSIPQQALLQSKVHQIVQQDNIKNKLVNILFQPNIQNYIFNTSQANPKAFIIYYHTVFLRNLMKRQKYVEFYKKCSELLTKKEFAEWYLKQVTESFLLEFVIYGDIQVRFIVTSLICQAMKIVVDLEFIQQCVGMLYLKNIIPFVKIFSHAYISHADYAKYLTSINLSQVILNLIKGKDIKENNIIYKVQVRKSISQFGLSATGFIQKKTFDPKDLLQAIQIFKVGLSLEQIRQLAVSIKNRRTLKSLAMITARRYKQSDQLKKLLDSYLAAQICTFDAKTGQESYYIFLILVIEELCKFNDKQTQQRVSTLAKLYINAMKQSITGFRSQLILFTQFFRICQTNILFRNYVSMILNDKELKKLVALFKDWLKELPNVINQIKFQKWGWWRNPKKNPASIKISDVQALIKPPVKQSLSLLNSVIQKHINEDIPQSLQIGNEGYVEQRLGPEHVKITRKIGFLVQVQDTQGNRRFINEDDVIKKFI